MRQSANGPACVCLRGCNRESELLEERSSRWGVLNGSPAAYLDPGWCTMIRAMVCHRQPPCQYICVISGTSLRVATPGDGLRAGDSTHRASHSGRRD
jgi:hypothetical protein